jgi:hypothetical protein
MILEDGVPLITLPAVRQRDGDPRQMGDANRPLVESGQVEHIDAGS